MTGNTVQGNEIGILATSGSTVSGNTARTNRVGIQVGCPSNVIGNTATNNVTNLFLQDAGCNNIDDGHNLAP
jgi:parallel beta-helix repeat protein